MAACKALASHPGICYDAASLRFICALCSPVAQQVEQAAVNRWVAGSNPARGAIFSRGFKVNPSLYKSSGVQLGHRWPALQGTHAIAFVVRVASPITALILHVIKPSFHRPPLIIVARLLAGLQAVEAPACSAD